MHRVVTLLHPSSNFECMASSCDRHLMICLKSTPTLISDAVNACKPGIAKQSAQGRLLSSA